MKKRLSIRIIASMLVFLMLAPFTVGCSKKNPSGNSGDPVTSSDTPIITLAPSKTDEPSDLPDDSIGPDQTPDGTSELVTQPGISETPGLTESPAPANTQSQAPTPTPVAPTVVPVTPDNATMPPNTGNNYVSIGTSSKPARFTMPTDLYGVSEANCENWFSDAVFCGDSLTLGWRNYNNKMLENNPNFFGQTHFLCEGSYGVGHAFDPISENSLHPVYGGEQHYLWDSISMMGANKVFILFGLNDLSIYGVDGTAERFEDLTNNIRAYRPGVQIFIISAMYMYKGSERERLNNRNLYLLNQRLVELCNRKGYEFINIASHLIDENGFVPDQYSSDHYVHQTYAAYAVWAEILRSVAARHISGQSPIVFTLPN